MVEYVYTVFTQVRRFTTRHVSLYKKLRLRVKQSRHKCWKQSYYSNRPPNTKTILPKTTTTKTQRKTKNKNQQQHTNKQTNKPQQTNKQTKTTTKKQPKKTQTKQKPKHQKRKKQTKNKTPLTGIIYTLILVHCVFF